MRTRMTITAFTDPTTQAFLFLLLVAVVFLAGSYPALILSKFRPIAALKGKLSQRHIGGFSLRRILVVTQFTISQMLIIGVIVIASQMHYSETSDLGFKKDGVVLLPVPQLDPVKMATLSTRMAAVPGTEKITLCSAAPASSSNNLTSFTYDSRPKEEPWDVNMKYADAQYVPAYDLRFVAGRNIFPNDTAREILVNEAFIRAIRLRKPSEALCKTPLLNTGSPGGISTIVGVVKDFQQLFQMHS